MSSLNDEILRVFSAGFGNDAQAAFLTANGFPTGPLQDRWGQFLTSQGVTVGSWNDRMLAWLLAQP